MKRCLLVLLAAGVVSVLASFPSGSDTARWVKFLASATYGTVAYVDGNRGLPRKSGRPAAPLPDEGQKTGVRR